MPDPTAREQKLIQYLNEAYGKEKQLETTLNAQIRIVQKPVVKKRLQDHLKETKAQSKGLERRIKALGGKARTSDVPGPEIAAAGAGAVANVANRALAVAKGPVQALRGTSASDNQLRNLRDAYWNEAEEIAHYNVIEAAADQLDDKETVKLAKDFRRQEERMQAFIGKQIPQLVRDVIKEEVPANERKPAAAKAPGGRSRSSSGSSRTTSRASSSGSSSRSSGRTSSGATKTRSSRTKSSGGRATSRAKSTSSANGGGASSSGRKSSTAKKT